MKKYFNIIVYILTAFLVWGCDDNDFDTHISYIFKTELQLPEEGTINTASELKLKLSSEIYKPDLLDHYFFFTDTKKSCLINSKGDTIHPNISTPVSITDDFLGYNFVGLAEGVHTLNFTFTNEKGYKTEIEKNITINLASYTFEATGSNIGAIKTPKYLTLNLTPDVSQPEDTKYKVKFKINNVVGTLSLNGKDLDENTYFEFSKGTSIFTFIPTILTQNADIEFTCIDSYGQIKTSKVSFKVQEAGFDFTMLLSSPSVILNQQNQVDFKITPIDVSSTSKYQMKFSTSGKATLGGHAPEDEWFDVNKGDFNLKYLPTTTGIHTINVFVKDDYGSIVNKELTIEVVPNQFNFTVASTTNSPEINTPKAMNFNISSVGDDTGQNYKLKYEVLQGEGELYNKDNSSIKPNTLIDVNKGDFNLNFKATTGGTVRIKFYAVNTDNFTVAKEVTLSVVVPNFNFTASLTNATQIVKQTNLINYAINPIGDIPQSFEIKYEDSGDGTLNGNNKGVWFDLSQGNGTLTFVPTTIGSHSIKLTVRNKIFLTEKTITLSVNVEYHKFDFNVTDENLEWRTDFENPLTFNIMPIGSDNGQEYELMYQVTTGKGTLSGFTALEYKKVGKGSFQINFKPGSGGAVSINFKVRNTDGVIVEKTLNIYNVVVPNFDLNSPNLNYSGTQGNSVNIPFTITNNETGNSEFYISLDKVPSDGTIKFNNQVVVANALYKISNPDNFQIQINNNKVETLTIKVKVKNAVTETFKEINYTTTAQSFSYSVGNIDDIKVGTSKNVNVKINSNYDVKYYVKFSTSGTNGNFTMNVPLNTWVQMNTKDQNYQITGNSYSSVVGGAILTVQVKDQFDNVLSSQYKNFTIWDMPVLTRTTQNEFAVHTIKKNITAPNNVVTSMNVVDKTENSFRVEGRPYNITNVTISSPNIEQKYKTVVPELFADRNLYFGQRVVDVNNIKTASGYNNTIQDAITWTDNVVGVHKMQAVVKVTDEKGNITNWQNF